MSNESTIADVQQLDARGQVCPYNVVLTNKEMTKLAEGERLEVVIDHPASLKTIPRWAESQGHAVISSEALDQGSWSIVLEKGAGERA